MTETKIVRGYYLTGLGQEPLAYYFKILSSHPDFGVIRAGDVAMTFYQNGDAITSIPALIRVDGVIVTERLVAEFLQGEEKDHLPMLPIVSIYEGFNPLKFQQLIDSFRELQSDIKRLGKVKYVQGELFEFLEDEESK